MTGTLVCGIFQVTPAVQSLNGIVRLGLLVLTSVLSTTRNMWRVSLIGCKLCGQTPLLIQLHTTQPPECRSLHTLEAE